MSIKLLFFLFLIIVFMPLAACSETKPNELVIFFSRDILSKNRLPTLADYYKYYGKGSEDEIKMLLRICEKKGWLPLLKSKECLDFIKNRQNNPEIYSSLYLDFIRSLLPLSPEIKIINVRTFDKQGSFKYQKIYAKLNDYDVEFFRPIGEEFTEEFGLISISKINGEKVDPFFEMK